MVEKYPGYLHFQKQTKPVSLRGQQIPAMELNLMTPEQTVLRDGALDGGAILHKHHEACRRVGMVLT